MTTKSNPQTETEEEYFNSLWQGLSKDELAKPVSDVSEKWKLLPAFLKVNGLVRQHIDSYNHFINVELEQIMLSNNIISSDVRPNWFFEYTRIYTEPAHNEQQKQITPQECRLRDSSYTANVFVDVRYVRGSEIVTKPRVLLCKMPVMLRSSLCVLANKSEQQLIELNECPFDPGGYFIVRGVEKVILIQEQLSKNRIIVELDKKENYIASVASSTHERKSKTTIITKNRCFYLHHNTFTHDIPILIVLKAMGVASDQQFLQLVGSTYYELLLPSIDECARLHISTQMQALDFISTRIRTTRLRFAASALKSKTKIDMTRDNLASVIFSHVPVLNYNFEGKILFTTLCLRRLCQVIQTPSLSDDRDYYGNKRLELAGQLLGLLFEDLFKRHNAELKRQTEHVLSKTQNRAEAYDVMKSFSDDLITNSLSNAISTGNWHVKRFKMERAGVTQVLSRLSFIAAVGMMTRITSQFEKTRKVSGPRSLQCSQFGNICPSDTPEGEACGLVKNLALMAHVTTEISEQPIIEWCYTIGLGEITIYNGEELNNLSTFVVMVNGNVIGITTNSTLFVAKFKLLRRAGYMSHFVSIYVNEEHRNIYISTDGGRLCRPVLIVENGIIKLTQEHINLITSYQYPFEHLVHKGVVEYLDVNEQNNCLIAISTNDITKYSTHLEIDPMTVLGVCAGLIPYPHHNQSPRNTYQCAMGKQAMGVMGYNQYNRIDTLLYLLVYPQRPMCQTHTIEMVNFDKLPAGQSATVFVMSYSGYDIEDASILNRAGLDRGFGRCMVMKKNVISIKQHPNSTLDQVFGPPPETSKYHLYHQNLLLNVPHDPSVLLTDKQLSEVSRYKSLDVDGICKVGLAVTNNDILINKYTPRDTESTTNDLRSIHTDAYRTQLTTYKAPEPSFVDQVLLTSSDNDFMTVKLLMRSTRRPELGDKFSSRHGQKGVCGLIAQQEDMPFTEMGVFPDLVMNPHGFPSRMTVGKMLELVAGKAGVLNGRFAYGTVFGGDKVPDIARGLINRGFSPTGKEIVTCGITGEPMPGLVFCGPIFYQKLKHMVLDKMHARSRGPRAILTRQPTEGRSRDGGLRLGEMERDCLIGYGAASVVTERLLYSADKFQAQVCLNCGLIQQSETCFSCISSLDSSFQTSNQNGSHVTNSHWKPNKFASKGPLSNHNTNKTVSLTLPYACKLLFQELQSMNILPRLRLETM